MDLTQELQADVLEALGDSEKKASVLAATGWDEEELLMQADAAMQRLSSELCRINLV